MSVEIEILLIEDNPSDIKLVMHAFQKSKLINQVQVLRDGAEALEYLFCTDRFADRVPGIPPKVILLDLKLPFIDGLEVLRRIKTSPETRDIPVVIMTSSVEEKDVIESYDLGVNSYVQKPIEFEKFVEAIAQLGMYWLLINRVPDGTRKNHG